MGVSQAVVWVRGVRDAVGLQGNVLRVWSAQVCGFVWDAGGFEGGDWVEEGVSEVGRSRGEGWLCVWEGRRECAE